MTYPSGVRIDVWSDLVCPFCHLGRRQMHAVRRLAEGDVVQGQQRAGCGMADRQQGGDACGRPLGDHAGEGAEGDNLRHGVAGGIVRQEQKEPEARVLRLDPFAVTAHFWPR